MPVRDTSKAANSALNKAKREKAVLNGLRLFIQKKKAYPSAYELFEFMKENVKADVPLRDLNAVRPRLTELKDKNVTRNPTKKICAVTGKTVYSWGVVGEVRGKKAQARA